MLPIAILVFTAWSLCILIVWTEINTASHLTLYYRCKRKSITYLDYVEIYFIFIVTSGITLCSIWWYECVKMESIYV